MRKRIPLDLVGRPGGGLHHHRADEIAETGDVYFFHARHHLIYEEETEALELNPADALEVFMDHVEAYSRCKVEESQR